MIRNLEIQPIIKRIFGDVNGYGHSEQIQVNCPQCQKRDGLLEPDGKFNLEINTAKNTFKCWKCDVPKFSGNIGKLIKYYGKPTDYEEYKLLVGIFIDDDTDKISYKVVLPKEFISFADVNINNPLHAEAYNYLIFDRKITYATAIKYHMGFCLDGKYKQRIILPSYDIDGNLNFYIGRTYNNKVRQKYDSPKVDKSNIIINELNIDWDSTVYLVEGGFDMLSFPINTIPLMGKQILERLYFKLKEKLPNVVVLLDPDAIKTAIEIFNTLKDIYINCEERVKIVIIDGEYDFDEYRKKYGIDEIIKLLHTAKDLDVDDIFRVKLFDSNAKYFKREYNQNKIWK